ncbi:hypothetical protein PC115_g11251 [Phytophthora cactorum]|uniref:NADH dehydrogenase [ubiquinone] 1 alpha subcomplex subunit 1 n=1 Tax=Phytophthora cactorum TaxID=29920 RepID=A0A8T1C770_9STRA|nr:hypothetical protein PC115_g11251 [Phytophthora cactorum]KAG3103099.1 hypothetical protein PC122_g1978 [Phytophthora cactorum]
MLTQFDECCAKISAVEGRSLQQTVESNMPYQVLPGLVVISVAFSLMGVGFGAVNKWQARNNMQSKLELLTDWDRMMDERDRKLAARAAAFNAKQ